jgi:hypothetical protein
MGIGIWDKSLPCSLPESEPATTLGYGLEDMGLPGEPNGITQAQTWRGTTAKVASERLPITANPTSSTHIGFGCDMNYSEVGCPMKHSEQAKTI